MILAIVHSCGLFLINIGEGTASLGVAVLPSVVEYLYDELDGVSDLMSPVQPLLTQAVTDDGSQQEERQKQQLLYNTIRFGDIEGVDLDIRIRLLQC